MFLDAYKTSEQEHGIFFRDGFQSGNIYNLSILTYDHSSSNVSPDGLSINAFDGVSICTGSNTRQQQFFVDSNGNVTKPNNPYVNAYRNGNVANVIGGSLWYTVVFNAERYDTGSDYSTSTGLFTAPVDGRYYVASTVLVKNPDNTNTDGLIRIRSSNKNYWNDRQNFWQNKSSTDQIGLGICHIIDMEAGDTMNIAVFLNGNTTADLGGGGNNETNLTINLQQ